MTEVPFASTHFSVYQSWEFVCVLGRVERGLLYVFALDKNLIEFFPNCVSGSAGILGDINMCSVKV